MPHGAIRSEFPAPAAPRPGPGTPVGQRAHRRLSVNIGRRGAARERWLLLGVTAAALSISGVRPTDRLTWILEVAPVLIALPLLIMTHSRFPLTSLSYRLIFAHAMLLIVGAHYTFSRVPIGAWLQETFGFARNHYDRIVHFVGGLAPSILAREILLRKTPLRPGRWLFLLVALSCLAGGAVYELLEWAAALFTGGEASAVLATQGDVWDTQWDLLLGLIGACVGQLLLGRRHQSELDVAGLMDPLPD